MARDPKGWELEDFIAAHFVSRGCYVETGVKERNPDEILELDVVWTDTSGDACGLLLCSLTQLRRNPGPTSSARRLLWP